MMQKIQKCIYYGICGGCKLYNVSYSEQLEFKNKKIIQVFSKLNESFIKSNSHSIYDVSQINPPTPAPELYRYRNKVEFTFFEDENSQTRIGFHQKGQFNKFIKVNDCLLMNENNACILEITENWAQKFKIKAYNKKTHKGTLRYLMIRNSYKTKDVLITIVTSDGHESMFQSLIDLIIKSKIKLKGFIWAKHSSPADVAALNQATLLYGDNFLNDSIGDKNFVIPFDSFFQTNNTAAKLLYDRILSYVKPKDIVMELFCGAGTISTYIANKIEYLLGIEMVDSAIKQAELNLKINGIDKKIEFVCGRVREEISKIRFDNDFNLVILDPPRSGTDKKTMRHIGKRKPDRIIYIACGLGELAYNLKTVMEFGYKISEISSIDMFPWTPHVEVIIFLEKIN